MKCFIKINDLYLKDFRVKINADENIINYIELDNKEFYLFSCGEEAQFMQFLITKELNIPKEKIVVYGKDN